MGENISTRVAYGRALAEFGADENIYVFDADLKKCTMTLYFSEKYPERFYNIGIISYNKYKSKYFFVKITINIYCIKKVSLKLT